MIQTRLAGVFGAAEESGSGSSWMIAESVWIAVARSNARFPAAIS